MPSDSERPDWYQDILESYETVAEPYADHYFHELSHKPFDHSLLENFAQLVPQGGLTCDLGCGPGHIARFLSQLGLDVVGVDISQAMVQVARRLNPGLKFEQGDMLRLTFPEATFAGIAAFYSLIHIDRARVAEALGEIFRVLVPGGRLLASFHVGEGEVHREEFLGHDVSFHATFFGMDEMSRRLSEAGFLLEEALERPPYEFEYPSQRGYILGSKPAQE